MILFTGGGVLSQHALQVVSQHALQQVSGVGGRLVSQHALQVSRPTAKGEVEGDLAKGGVPAPGEGACSGGGVWRPPPRDGYCCGRYASYWNAFLFTTVVNDLYFQLLRIYAWICLFRDGALKRSKPKDSFKEKYQEDFSKRLKGE